jgi:hypothetical protein
MRCTLVLVTVLIVILAIILLEWWSGVNIIDKKKFVQHLSGELAQVAAHALCRVLMIMFLNLWTNTRCDGDDE